MNQYGTIKQISGLNKNNKKQLNQTENTDIIFKWQVDDGKCNLCYYQFVKTPSFVAVKRKCAATLSPQVFRILYIKNITVALLWMSMILKSNFYTPFQKNLK